MAVSLSKSPEEVLFALDGISYGISVGNRLHNRKAIPVILTFEVVYHNAGRFGWQDALSRARFDITVYATPVMVSGSSICSGEVDLTDIIAAYTEPLHLWRDHIHGYATVQLVAIDGEDSDLDESPHICLFGTLGEWAELTPAEQFSGKFHPFLLSHGSEGGGLRLYRSELRAMGYIYAFIPDYDTTDFFIETDNRTWPDQDLDALTFPEEFNRLVGICLDYEMYVRHYAIWEEASALFVHYGSHSATIMIDDDPDTDETYLVRWINSMGAPEVLLFSGALKDISEIEDPELYIHQQSHRSTIRKQRRGMVTRKYSLHTGYLTPARIKALIDLLSSEEVDLQIDGQWVSVSVTADPKHAAHQREPEDFELTIEMLEQTRYPKLDRTINPLPASRDLLLLDNKKNIIIDNNSNTIQEDGKI